MSAPNSDIDGGEGRLLRLESHLRAQYVLAGACIAALAVTGLPQKFDSLSLSRDVMDLAGGIEALQLAHRAAAGALVLTGVYHIALLLAAMLVGRETAPLRMIPNPRDFRDAVRAALYFLRLESESPDARSRQYMHKLDYWFIAWSLGVMAATGFVNLMPLRVASVVSAEMVLAAVRTHSDAAPFVIAWVVLVHLPYSNVAPRLFRTPAPGADAPRPVTEALEARLRAAATSPESAVSVAVPSARRPVEPHAKDQEALL